MEPFMMFRMKSKPFHGIIFIQSSIHPVNLVTIFKEIKPQKYVPLSISFQLRYDMKL